MIDAMRETEVRCQDCNATAANFCWRCEREYCEACFGAHLVKCGMTDEEE